MSEYLRLEQRAAFSEKHQVRARNETRCARNETRRDARERRLDMSKHDMPRAISRDVDLFE